MTASPSRRCRSNLAPRFATMEPTMPTKQETNTMHTMKQWEVHFHIGYLDMPGFKGLFGSDRVPMGYMTTEQAPTRKQAIEQATVKALDFDSRAKLHKITELHSFAVTAKGK